MKPDLITNNQIASRVWDYYADLLEKAGKWKPEYEAHFAVLVDAIAGFLETSATLAMDGNAPVLVNPRKGTTYRNPLLDIKQGHINTIRVFGAAFGLNPLADMRLRQSPANAIGDLFAELLKGPQEGA